MSRPRRKALMKEILNLCRSLRSTDRSLHRLVPMLAPAVFTNGEPKRNSRPRLSPKVRASLVLQGRYMGYMRQLKPKQKAQVRKIREAKGMRAAIARARALA